MRLPSAQDQHDFCRADGWIAERESGHTVYRTTLANGDVLTTQVAHGNKGIRDPNLFTYICREQLRCTPEEFWNAVDRGIAVPRPQPEEPPARVGLPYGLVRALRALGHSEQRIQALASREEASALLNEGSGAS